jgi:glycosyltransferase involved in cell wall biosynthesis
MNQGGSAARNHAFSLSQGEYIQWLDADDLLAPDKIARQMEAVDAGASKRALFSSSWGYFMYRPHRAWFTPTPLWTNLPPLEWLLRKWEHNVHMNPATWLVSRELTQTAGPWDTRLISGEDGEYFCRVIMASDGIHFVPDAKVFYRTTSSSGSYIGRSNKKLESVFLSMRLEIDHVHALDDSKRTRAACVQFLQTWLHNFYPDRPDIVDQAAQLASTLGGQLGDPRVRWKYAWIKMLFGPERAKRASLLMPKLKWELFRAWDKILFHLERWNLGNRTGRFRTKPAA